MQSRHCDIWAKDAFGPSSWGLPFGPEPVLRDFSWIWNEGEVWAILGSNTSGKEALAYALVGQAVVRPRELDGSWVNTLEEGFKKGVVLSFEEAEKAIRYSVRFDESDFVEGGQHPGLTVAAFLGIGSPLRNQGLEGNKGGYGFDFSVLWEVLGLEAIWSRGLKYLSTGELRKVLLFKALWEAPPLLVCEDLWEGLDAQSRQEVTRFFQALIEGRRSILDHGLNRQGDRPGGDTVGSSLDRSPLPAVLFLCDREDQILPSVTHVLRLKDGKVEGAEKWREETNLGKGCYYPDLSPPVPHATGNSASTQAVRVLGEEEAYPDLLGYPAANSLQGWPLIRMKNIRVAYADHVVFEGFGFKLYPGEHCFIQGPNGCGKSTLVKLITGDHPQGWGNEIVVAGIPRKIGERLQDVRMQSSLVSHELHRSFLALEEVSALEVVLSGLFGTVGLYEPVGEEKMEEAAEALQICGLSGYGNRLFKDLPWGIQRLVLAARAFVRRPPLMILDEPCTGLDEEHRKILLATLERIAEEGQPNGQPTILLVTHDPAERLPCMKVHLRFYQEGRTENGQPHYRWEFSREARKRAGGRRV